MHHNTTWIFDIDGTLTSPQESIDKKFQQFFLQWIPQKRVVLVGGSSYESIVQQIGKEICENVEYVCACQGNSQWHHGQEVYTQDWQPPHEVIQFLHEALDDSPYPERYGSHVNYRQGMINFSIIGRNATPEQRRAYILYDLDTLERRHIMMRFNERFPFYASIGGQISIDITPSTGTKAQILSWIPAPVIFFGDALSPIGNDYHIGQEIMRRQIGGVFSVSSWQNTWEYLQQLS